MAATKPAVKWSDIKKCLRERGQSELIDVIHELFKLSTDNQVFLATRLFGSVASENALDSYCRRIEQVFYGRNGSPQDRLQLGEARKIIRDYRKATDDLRGTLELMLTYVETGTKFTLEFGDIDAPFYDSLASVLDETRRLLMSNEGRALYDQYRSRLLQLAKAAAHLGWGYGDDATSIVADLEQKFAAGSPVHALRKK